jgi:hypothetical protein
MFALSVTFVKTSSPQDNGVGALADAGITPIDSVETTVVTATTAAPDMTDSSLLRLMGLPPCKRSALVPPTPQGASITLGTPRQGHQMHKSHLRPTKIIRPPH